MDIIQEAKAKINLLNLAIERATGGQKEEGEALVDLISRLVDRLEWKSIDSAPKAIPKKIFPVLVTRLPATGKPPIMIAHLTSNGWCVKGYGLAPRQYDGKPWGRRYRPLHFQPTHWLPLPPVRDK